MKHDELVVEGVSGPIRPAAHLLVLPVPFLQQDGKLYLELQAADGLREWVSNFDNMIVAAPTISESQAARILGMAWVPTERFRPAVQFVPLPLANVPKDLLRHYRHSRAILADCIESASYLQFALGGLVGDWAGVAAEIAIRKGRRYAVHLDRVEEGVVLELSRHQPLLRRVKARVKALVVRRWRHRLISHASLSLCQGGDCLNAYGKLNPVSQMIYDVHVEVDAERIDQLSARKQEQIRSGAPLEVCYTGRLAPEKGPLDWIRAIGHANTRGVKLRATWLGDGPLRAESLALVERMRLGDVISFPGFVEDRQRVMELIASSHAMLFTHLAPESPRCLVEALMHATPVIGYDTDHSKDLVKENGGGLHARPHDFRALGELLVGLNRDRSGLAALIRSAAMDGRHFGTREVFRRRSELIMQHLG